MTKIHEQTVRGSLDELSDYFKEKPVKGEIVIVISGKVF
jgi:16S rRNA (cytidine1402-2'-O)-methyltransferase